MANNKTKRSRKHKFTDSRKHRRAVDNMLRGIQVQFADDVVISEAEAAFFLMEKEPVVAHTEDDK